MEVPEAHDTLRKLIRSYGQQRFRRWLLGTHASGASLARTDDERLFKKCKPEACVPTGFRVGRAVSQGRAKMPSPSGSTKQMPYSNNGDFEQLVEQITDVIYARA